MKSSLRVLVPALACAVAAAVGCSKSSGPSSSSGGAAAATTAAAPAAAGAKKPTTTLTNQQLQDAYKAANKGMTAADKQLSMVKTALGAPTKTTGDKNCWYAWKPKDTTDPDCMELCLSPTKGNSIGGSDWGNCGMKN
ncbi:MAG TPA: hypothetical protein VGG39_02390 [Polyangiaceae bacterium]|jgi:hypothetical protein